MLGPHHVQTVQGAGWSGIKSGRLLALCATRFECLLTVDRNLAFQQRIQTLPVAVLVINCRSNSLTALAPWVPDILKALAHLAPCAVTRVGNKEAPQTSDGVSEQVDPDLRVPMSALLVCRPRARYVVATH